MFALQASQVVVPGGSQAGPFPAVLWLQRNVTDMASNTTIVIKACIAALLLAASFACSKEETEVNTLTRSTDKITLAYDNSTATFTVRNVGSWSVWSEAEWLSFDPSKGNGDGNAYTTVTVTAEANSGDERSAVIYLEGSGKKLTIDAVQEAGFFELGDPVLGGAFRVNIDPVASIDVPYRKAKGGESVKVTAVFSGPGSAGLVFNEYETVIAASGDGTISAPFSGTPTAMDDLSISFSVSLNGEEVKKGTISATVLDENTLLLLPESKFPWGGHYLEKTPGIRSIIGEAAGVSPDDETEPCAYNTPGTTDLFRSDMTEFRAARGLSGYAGNKVYEFGGSLKIGTSAVGGYFITPALSALTTTSDILVEFDYYRWKGDTGEVTASAVDGGEMVGGILSTESDVRIHYALTVKDATPWTKIRWAASDATSGKSRFFLAAINITVASAVNEPLAAPTDLEGTAYESSVKVTWKSVRGASAYDFELSPASAPGFVKAARVASNEAIISELAPNTDYKARVRAVYEKDESFNSAWSEWIDLQTLSVLSPLTAPVVSVYKSERAMVIATWSADMTELTSRTFSLELRNASGEVLRSYPKGNYGQSNNIYPNRFVFGGLEPSTAYKIAVKRITTDATKYKDSDWTVLDYTSEPDVNAADYVFYEDFNDNWIGGHLGHLAWGPHTAFSGNYNIANYISREASMTQCNVICNAASTCANVWKSAYVNKYVYMNDYWLKWNYGSNYSDESFEAEAGNHLMLYPGAGCVKYGSGSSNGYLMLPELRSLTAPTDLTVSFDVIPYALPTAADGELVDITDGETCSVTLVGDGSIDGATAGVLAFDNKSPKELGGFKLQTHSFTITGATSSTRIVIASGSEGKVTGGVNRIWLDKVTVVKK